MDLEPTGNRRADGHGGAVAGEFAGADADLDVEVVEEVPGDGGRRRPATLGTTGSTSARVARERLRRLALEARVATLEERLEAKQQQCEEVIARYEAVLDGRETAEPVGTWTEQH